MLSFLSVKKDTVGFRYNVNRLLHWGMLMMVQVIDDVHKGIVTGLKSQSSSTYYFLIYLDGHLYIYNLVQFLHSEARAD